MPPGLEGRVLTAGTPGKSQFAFLFLRIFVFMFMDNFGLEFSWLIVLLTGVGVKVLLGSRNEAGVVSPYFLNLCFSLSLWGQPCSETQNLESFRIPFYL